MYFCVIKLKKLLAMVICFFAVVYAGVNFAVPIFSVNGREVPIYSVERGDNKISLTFDCAWNDEDVDEILDTLDKYGAKATFFVVGNWVNKYSESLEKIYSRGHEIGTHSMSHKDYTQMTPEEMMKDINECENTVMNIIGDRPFMFRAPSGAYNDSVIKTAEENDRLYIQWSVDGLDYTEDATVESICDRVINNVSAGDIILLHNGTQYTAKALPIILEELSKEYEFSKLIDMVHRKNFVIDNTGRQFLKD